jgi:hypothetical protein
VRPASTNALRDCRRRSFFRTIVSGLFALLTHSASADPGLGLPSLEVFQNDPSAASRAGLGGRLFMDRRLSRNGTMSCGMCHVPEQGFTTNEMATAIGIEGRSLRRNAPTILNVGFQHSLFHDGRETSLERQIWSPLLAADEMGNASRAAVVAREARLADVRRLHRAKLQDVPLGVVVHVRLPGAVAALAPVGRRRRPRILRLPVLRALEAGLLVGVADDAGIAPDISGRRRRCRPWRSCISWAV